MNQESNKQPSLFISLLPVIFLVSLLIINVKIFKDDATGGANQLALLFSALFTAFLGTKVLGIPYKELEKKAIASISMAMQANIILLLVGSIIGIWIISGIVPTMIYYGVQLISPTWFLPVSCIICAIVSLSTGSSWSTGGTVGIALIGIGQTLGIPVSMVAGAIISGSYFGDKMSPLSDTTNLAPAVSGSELIEHVKHMIYSTGPAIVIAVIMFTIVGFFYTGKTANIEDIDIVVSVIDKNFNVGLYLLLVPVAVIVMVAKKVPAIPAMFVGLLLGALCAVIFQQDVLTVFSSGEKGLAATYKSLMVAGYNGFEISSGNKLIDSLFSRGGMSGMLSTVWLIIVAMLFGGMMEATGMLLKIANAILKMVNGCASLVASTIGTSVVLNMTASDQYLAIVVTGKMFAPAYKKFGLKAKNLSRAVEDGATVTSVLVPWNSGGAYFSSILGVATLSYLPFCFFNILSPLISILLAVMGWTMEREEDHTADLEEAAAI